VGIDPSSIQNPKFKAALEKAQAQERPRGKVYTLSPGLLKPSTLKSVAIPGLPIAKPRMTRRDQWEKRDCVLRYRDYCDRIRAAWAAEHGDPPVDPDGIMVVAFLPVTASWPKWQKEEALDCGHKLKPDGDNILKSVCDALMKEDSCLWVKWIVKFWCAEGAESTHLSVLWYE